MIKQLLTVIVLWAILGAFVCQTEMASSSNAIIQQVVEDNRVSRRDLSMSMRRQKAMHIVYSGEQESENPTYQAMTKYLAKDLPEDWQFSLLSERDITAAQLKDVPLMVVGYQFTNPGLRRLLDQLPFQSIDSLFTFNDRTYNLPNHSFRLFFYPNPNSKSPIFYIGGNSPEAIQEQLGHEKEDDWGYFFWGSWGYEIYEGSTVIVRGNFKDKDWTFDPNNHFDFSQQKKLELTSGHFRFIDLANSGQLFMEQLAKDREAQINILRSFTGSKEEIPPIDYYVYPSIEEKGLRLTNTREGHLNEKKRAVHVVINEIFKGQHTHQDIQLMLHDLIGPAKQAFADQGLAAHFNPHWQERGPNYWAARLYQSNNLPPITELFDDQLFRQESPLVMTAAAGSLISFLIKDWGRNKFLTFYREGSFLTPSEIERLEKGWHAYLKQIDTEQAKRSNTFLPYYRGFNFAHEGYQIYNGYGSKLAKGSLETLTKLGTNAVAIVPYGYQPNPNQPSFLRVQHGAGSENDESVIFSHAQAQKLGMYTLMKPQLWVSGSWPGDVKMSDDKAWREFFDYYYRWIRHYALISEMRQFDALCLGVEFSIATRTQPEAWRTMIRKIKSLYSGPITYAANWGEEFEQLNFWDELDFIGLNCYYPLSDKNKDQIDKEVLKQAFTKVLKKAESISKKYNKPLVLTEVGFRSVEDSWKNPHAEANGRPYDPECQRVCYEILFEGIQGKEWIKGLFLWKWPSYINYQQSNPVGFTPSGKPAELVVKEWFGGRL